MVIEISDLYLPSKGYYGPGLKLIKIIGLC